jgi:hypothetical protein
VTGTVNASGVQFRLMRGSRTVVLVIALLTVVGTACASTKSAKSPSASTTPGATLPHVAGMGPGVTAKQINLGIVLIDYKCIPGQFVGNIEEPLQQQAFQAFIDDINQKGGINGRQIKPFYKTVCPLQPAQAPAACTSLADDDNVFATLGVFGDETGAADLCMTTQKHRILITYDLSQELINKAPAGQLLTPDILPDRKVKVVMSLLGTEHILDGKTVGILGDAVANDRIHNVIEPELAKLPIKHGTTGIITVTSSDTTAAQAQVEGFIQKWKTEGVNALVLSGDAAYTQPFVDQVKAALPHLLLVSDSTDVLTGGQAEVMAHKVPNSYTGVITAEGLTGLEHTQTDHFKECKATFEAHTHVTVPSPNAVILLPDGRKNNIYGAEEDACVFVYMFDTIATKVGADLNNANWTTVVNNFGPIDIRSTNFASLHTGKYDADDTYGLVEFDPTIPTNGDWKHLTPVRNVGNTG